MGIRESITPGSGMFPLLLSSATSSPEQVLAKDPVQNHKSFRDKGIFEDPPGQAVVEGHMNQGFGLLFKDRASAEEFVGGAHCGGTPSAW